MGPRRVVDVAMILSFDLPTYPPRLPMPDSVKFRALSPGFGLETHDLDLSQPIHDAVFDDVRDAFFRGQVLVLRAQRLTPAQFVAFARRFGPPEPHVIDQFHHPADPNILILSNRISDGKPAGLADAGTYFHTDYSYLDVPAQTSRKPGCR